MVQNIHIRINKSGFYIYNRVSNPVSLKVTEYEPYDQLSKKFNKYTHVIQYPPKTEYRPDDYVLCLDDPNARIYYYILYLYGPTKKIVSVDIFFLSNDKDRINPLIFGFNYVDNTSAYYTYYYVRWIKYFYGSMGSRGLITKDDLISRLMDERGIYESDSYHKFVIRLNDKPNEFKPIQYPKGGNNSGMITLKKSDVQDQENYLSFEHSISSLSNVESFYVSFHQNTLYMVGGSKFGKLQSALVYYNKYNGDIPVAVVFRFPSRVKLYRFSKFNSDATQTTKNIDDLENFSSNDLKQKLVEEYRNVFKEITFKQGKGNDKYISTISERYVMNKRDEFRRAILRPNLDSSKGGHSSGPYDVYSYNLFKKYTKKDFEDKSFDSLDRKKFSSIYIYYTSKNEPLLIGFIGESDNTFFRISKGGKSWEKDSDNIKTYNIGYLYSKLVYLEKEKNEEVPEQARGSTHQSARTSGPSATHLSRQPRYKSIKLDISKASSTIYDGIINVSTMKTFDKCNLFCYFKHSHKDGSDFTISSIIYGTSTTTTIDLIKSSTRVKHVLVYFNINELKKPILLEFFQSNGMTNYFLNIGQTKNEFPLLLSERQEYQVVDELIKANDSINERNTYQIHRPSSYNSVKVTPNPKTRHGFTINTHTPDTLSKKSNVLYFDNVLIGSLNKKHEPIQDIQNKHYKEIIVYCLNASSLLPIVVKLTDDKSITTTYLRAYDETGPFWENKEFKETDDNDIKIKLEQICYLSSKSIIIEIDKKVISVDSNSYDMKVIDNRSKNDTLFPQITDYSKSKSLVPSIKILVIDEKVQCKTTTNHGFKCFSHIVQSGSSESNYIYGLRLYLPKIDATEGGMDEIKLYKDKTADDTNRMFIYYAPDSKFDDPKNKVYVYFYHYDPRPLLICFNNYFFQRIDEKNDFQWYNNTDIKSREVCDILSPLKQIFKSMKRKLIFLKDGYLGSVQATRYLNFGKFRKDAYTIYLLHEDDHFSGLTKENLIGKTTSKSNIDNLLDKLDRRPFEEVNVYMNKTSDTNYSLKDILLIEFINESKKIHFKRKDVKGDVWEEKLVGYKNDDDLENELEKIKKGISTTPVYEPDRKTSESSNIKISKPEAPPSKAKPAPPKPQPGRPSSARPPSSTTSRDLIITPTYEDTSYVQYFEEREASPGYEGPEVLTEHDDMYTLEHEYSSPYLEGPERWPPYHSEHGRRTELEYAVEEEDTPAESVPAQVGKIAGGVVGTAATVGTGIGVAYAAFPQWFIPVINALV